MLYEVITNIKIKDYPEYNLGASDIDDIQSVLNISSAYKNTLHVGLSEKQVSNRMAALVATTQIVGYVDDPKFQALAGGFYDVCASLNKAVITSYSIHYTKLYDIHGLTVESAEALAEYWHKSIRAELGIGDRDADEIRRLFSQGYQGSRYSFGYPACPNLEDQRQLFALLAPERGGITLTEAFQLVPEQSTSAIIVHHPEARYFNVK